MLVDGSGAAVPLTSELPAAGSWSEDANDSVRWSTPELPTTHHSVVVKPVGDGAELCPERRGCCFEFFGSAPLAVQLVELDAERVDSGGLFPHVVGQPVDGAPRVADAGFVPSASERLVVAVDGVECVLQLLSGFLELGLCGQVVDAGSFVLSGQLLEVTLYVLEGGGEAGLIIEQGPKRLGSECAGSVRVVAREFGLAGVRGSPETRKRGAMSSPRSPRIRSETTRSSGGGAELWIRRRR